MNKYYSMAVQDTVANINIYGDITSYDWYDSDVSSYSLAKQLDELKDVDIINVYINSYGGEVAEGLAIYNALVRHKAKIKTFCDGFACSIASVIFMAGEERIMSNASLLFIHNAWTYTAGDANQLRKQANDLEKISSAGLVVYLEKSNLDEETLKQMLDEETWIKATEALEMGFATSIVGDSAGKNPSQSAKSKIMQMIVRAAIEKQQKKDEQLEGEPSEEKIPGSENELKNFFNNLAKVGR